MKARRYTFLMLPALLLSLDAAAQCPQLYDYNGTPSSTPVWYSCSGTNFTLVLATPTAIGPFSVDWGDGSPVFVGTSLTPPQTVNHVYTAAVAEYTVTFTDPLAGCTVTGTVIMEQSTSASIQIPVGGLTQVCAPQAVEFINSSTNTSPNTVFVWDFGDASATQTFDHTNLGQTLTHTYMPGTVSCETTVRLTAYNSCNTLQGGPSIATFNPIRVWDIDSANITPSATLLCWPDNIVTFLNTTDRNCLQQGNIYQRYEHWNFGNYWGTGQDSIIDWTPWPPTFPHTLAYPAIGSYQVTMLDSNYCGIDTARVTITIVPPPTVTLATPAPICAGGTINFTQTTAGGANYYQWDFGEGAGLQWTGAGNQSHTYNTPGTYTVRYMASIQGATSGCADTASVQVVVLQSPTAQFTLDHDAACISLTTDPTNTSINGVTYLWDFGDGTTDTQADPPPHTYAAVGNYTIALTAYNNNGCHHTVSHQVHVYALPQPVIGTQNVCIGAVAEFADLTVTAPGNPVVQWLWDFGDGATDTVRSPDHLYASAGTYAVTLTTTTPYCSGTSTLQVTVEAKPVAGVTAAPVTGCSPMAVTFTNTSTGAVGYIWQFGDGGSSNDTDPTHTYTNPGTADSVRTVQVIASTLFGCTDTATTQVTVSPAVVAMFTHDAVPGCAPLAVHFTNNSTGAGSYLWDFGDGNTSTDVSPDHVYINTTFVLQTMTVTLTATSWAGCSHTTQQSIIVYPAPNFSFVSQPDSGCSPLTVTFPSVVGAVTYQWQFGDGATGSGPSPSHTYVNSTTASVDFAVRLIATNAFGCSDTTYGNVHVYPVPAAQFSVSNVSGCHPLMASLQNTSSGAVTYHWNYGDGHASDTTAAMHAYTWYNFMGPGAVTYPISLTATSQYGCASMATAQVEVFPQVVAGFTSGNVGCSPFDPHFVNVSTGATDHLWTYGDGAGSVLVNAAHTYVNDGLADVTFHPTLVVTSSFGCRDTAEADILVHPAPIAQFVASPDVGCTPLPVNLQDLTIGSVSQDWQFGDGGSATGPVGNVAHTFTNTGTDPITYIVRLVSTSSFGCTDTVHVPVEVYPPVNAAFELPAEACSPVTVDLERTGTGASQWLWDMGDGNTLVGSSVSHTYVNTTSADVNYAVTQTATSIYGCTSTVQHTILVHPVPDAAFQALPFTMQYPDATVTIHNNTAPGPWTFAWSFGDGATSAVEQPGTHTYAAYGTYTITLTVSAGSCTDVATQDITILPPLPIASFIGSGEGCAPLTVSFTNTSQQAIGYQWDFGDGGTSIAVDPVYTYYVPGTYTVKLTAIGIGGATATAIKVDSVVVHPSATAYFILQPDHVVVPAQPVFTYNLSGNANGFIWDFGDGTFSNDLNPVHYYQQAGTYDVGLIALNEWNCADTFAITAAVTAIAGGEITFPNAFTPGNSGPTDGVYDPQNFSNDHFYPHFSGVQDFNMQVFNRWGEMVFETNDIRKGWDGYYRGRPAKQDVYAWKAYARFSNGEETRLSGDVTLLR